MNEQIDFWKPIHCVITGDIISITMKGKAPMSIRRSTKTEQLSERFDELKLKVSSAMKTGSMEEWEEIKAIFVPSVNMKEIIETSIDFEGVENIECKDGKFFYKGYEIKNYLADKIIELQNEADILGIDPSRNLRSLALFLNNLMENPSSNSVQQLFNFVEHTRMPITDDGHLLAYKIITHDYKDKFTETFDYSIGSVAAEPRSIVESNPNITCSRGLHFCSWNYATGFFNNPDRDRMVVVKINPKNVVSVPTDYNAEKGRCCEYQIYYEIPMEEVIQKDVLGMLKAS